MAFCTLMQNKIPEVIACWSREPLVYHVIMQIAKIKGFEKSSKRYQGRGRQMAQMGKDKLIRALI